MPNATHHPKNVAQRSFVACMGLLCALMFFGHTLKHVALLFNDCPTITLPYLLLCFIQRLMTTLDEERATGLEQTVKFLEKTPGLSYMMEHIQGIDNVRRVAFYINRVAFPV